ncbi:MAG TPA: phage portal protein [Candidatus Jeotgalibaca merdavium]|uniref:Phage portal protein n=1 Tax=Candidatus Jeotgalibaca merdavium TaxID=2838627 RepID=A0A9D2KXF8_9LACT|nr:phage portal protein [Candidatus Jeotgalibaca merdavium]
MEKGIDYLRKKLKRYRAGAIERQKIYNMKDDYFHQGVTIPPKLRMQYKATLGWGSKAVDSIADRLVFREFRNDVYDLNGIFNMNSPDILFDDAGRSALTNSCSFIYISEDNGSSIPRLQVISGDNATGILDPISRLLTEGYAVLSRDDSGEPYEELYFLPGMTLYYLNGHLQYPIAHNVDYPLLVPVIHRPDATKPFGRSRITPSAIYYQNYAKRTLERSDITAEFYSWPQKYIVGLESDAEPLEKWRATVSSFLQFNKGEGGELPKLGQFNVPSMSPFTEQLRTAASGFAGETGLTLDDLGFSTDNPSSAEAIKASHESLRLAAEKAQRDFSSGFLNAGFLAACLRDDFAYKRNQLYNTKPIWEPVFKPDASTLSLLGDGAYKLNQAFPGYFDAQVLQDLTGIKGADRNE